MAVYNFTAADNSTASVASPMPVGVETMLWASQEFDTTAEGSNYTALELTVEYHSFTPDTTDPTYQPFNFEVTVIAHSKQDGRWIEIARQNTPIRKVTQGRVRKIVVAPNMILTEEGIDQYIPGLGGGEPALIKSRSGANAEGNLRFCLVGKDYDPTGPNPFQGVVLSVHGKRYDP